MLELFASGGVALTRRVYPTLDDAVSVGLYAENGDCVFPAVEAWAMKSAPVHEAD